VRAVSEACRVLLTGGTSQVGIFAIPLLNAAGQRVISISRRVRSGPDGNEAQSVGNVQWVRPSALGLCAAGAGNKAQVSLLGAVELLLSCGPVHVAAKLVPMCPRLKRLVCISSSSVMTKPNSPNRAERELIATILAAEADLKALCAAQDINLVLLRPTLIYGCGRDRNVSRLARWIRRLGFMPLAGRASGLRQPIHAEDVAEIAVKALLEGSLDGWDGVLRGGNTLAYRAMVEHIFRALGRKPRLLPVPPRLLGTMIKGASCLPGLRDLNAEFALRQNQDLVFDDPHLPAGVAFTPRPFSPTAADFEIPAEARLFQPR